MDQNRRNILVRCLATVFGEDHDTLIAEVLPLLELLELNGGQTLVNKNDPADAVYFVVSGRLRTHVKNEEQRVQVDEITRGETFGAAGVLMRAASGNNYFGSRQRTGSHAGIEVDFVGGTSIGAVMAAYVSFDRPAEEVIEYARQWHLT